MTTQTLPTTGTYTVDAVHSSVGFVARHLVAAKVRGQFTQFEGTITIGDSPETSSVSATVQASSITTANETRDAHLQAPEFLDQVTHPTLELRSTSITPNGSDRFAMVADLTIRGVTKSITFDLEFLGSGPGFAPGVEVAGFEAHGEIDRRDFGITFEGVLENGAVVVGNKVTLEINVEAHQVV
jgi:polyisoprenoid-binding protein YceI